VKFAQINPALAADSWENLKTTDVLVDEEIAP
jgi:hypothetical protein